MEEKRERWRESNIAWRMRIPTCCWQTDAAGTHVIISLLKQLHGNYSHYVKSLIIWVRLFLFFPLQNNESFGPRRNWFPMSKWNEIEFLSFFLSFFFMPFIFLNAFSTRILEIDDGQVRHFEWWMIGCNKRD